MRRAGIERGSLGRGHLRGARQEHRLPGSARRDQRPTTSPPSRWTWPGTWSPSTRSPRRPPAPRPPGSSTVSPRWSRRPGRRPRHPAAGRQVRGGGLQPCSTVRMRVLTVGPNLRWKDVPVGAELRGRLGRRVAIENEGQRAAITEGRPGDPPGLGHPGDLRRGRRRGQDRRGRPATAAGRGTPRRAYDRCRAAVGAGAGRIGRRGRPVAPALSLDGRLSSTGAPNRRQHLDALDQVGNAIGTGVAMLTNALNPAAVVAERLLRGDRPTCGPPSGTWSPACSRLRHQGSSRRSASPPPSGGARVALQPCSTTRPWWHRGPTRSWEEPDDRTAQMTGIVRVPGRRALDGVGLDVPCR